MLKTSFFFCLVLLSAMATASGQSAAPKALPSEALEKYGDPPSFIFANGISPATISPHGGFTSYQVNVNANGQNITGDAANEPSISVDPTNRNKMGIGWRQFDSVSSNFRQAGWGFTSNGGVSWPFPDALVNNVVRGAPLLSANELGQS